MNDAIEMTACPEHRRVDTLPVFLSVAQAAELLQINEKTIREAFHRGELPGAVRIGERIIRVHRDTLIEQMVANKASRRRRS